jgi:Rac GTPase-activating protein 1
MPCLPRLITPKKDVTKALRLDDFCLDSRPKVPYLVSQCVSFLEKTLSDADLYLSPGNEAMSTQLFTFFKLARNMPVLSEYELESVAGCIMKFLAEIRDPLVLETSHSEFFKAANDAELIEAIRDLPAAHCDTLAFLCCHWKRLGELVGF